MNVTITDREKSQGILQSDNGLLIVEDDRSFRGRLMTGLERSGFAAMEAETGEQALRLARGNPPKYAIVDMRLDRENGLELVSKLRAIRSDMKVVILSGYGNIAAAVSAIKVGAVDFLAKPAGTDDIQKALLSDATSVPEPPENPMSADRVKWEHIQRVFELCDRNVSETARRLNMHRRTLQRILGKRSPT